MTINHADPRMIDRQFKMQGCGVSPAMIAQMIESSDEVIARGIADGEARLATLTGERLDRAQGILNALRIEADLRK